MDPLNDNDESLSRPFNIRANWVVVGESANRIIAEFAVNGLKSYDIPAVIDARPGVLGTSGLTMRSLRTGRLEKFKILVPEEHAEEAKDLIKMFLGPDDTESGEGDSEDN